MKLRPGLYDQLLTERLRARIAELRNAQAQVLPLDEAESPHYLARHIANELERQLRELEAAAQVGLANGIAADDPVVDPPQLLRAVYQSPQPPAAPSIPLSQSGLILNASDEPRLGFELEREMATADEVWMLVSFIQWRGWQRLRVALETLARQGKPVRVLTTTYMGASDYRALEALANLPNVEMRVSTDNNRRRLHAKAWLFVRNSGFSSAYVGSANLSAPALEDGIEWTVKLSEVETPHVIGKFRGAFESHWNDPDFVRFSPQDPASAERVRKSLAVASQDPARRMAFFDLEPHPYQQATLDRLEQARITRNQWRNLVVAPTGTGKTLIAAFDYARQPGPRPRLLFLAHREELLLQARDAFRQVLRDESFGALLSGGQTPDTCDFLFATIQSMTSRELLRQVGADFWKFVVVDEAHHTPAGSYRDLIAALRPQILLGLTATPERMDGESILDWFDGTIADEMRLWHAIERQYLVPFDYYGVSDGTDLSSISWRRGGYAIAELNQMLSTNERRAQLVIQQFRELHGDPLQARALAFCVSVEHAGFMAEMFRKAGIPAQAVTSQSAEDIRRQAPQRLAGGDWNVITTVDLYNEGVDIPAVDTLLFLRPTESVTVFLQQLGRGLRLARNKRNCLVLDFIGQQRREFRFDLRYRALFGGTRQQVQRQLETGVTRLPGNCYFRLDSTAREVVLRNLRASLETRRSRMLEEVRQLAAALGQSPSLAQFLTETQYDLADIYKDSIGGWLGLVGNGDDLSDTELLLSRQFKFLLHWDDNARLSLLTNPGSGHPRLELAFTHRWLQGRAAALATAPHQASRLLQAYPRLQREANELAAVLREEARAAQWLRPDWPLALHCSYTRDEILTAVGHKEFGGRAQSREGVLWLKADKTELLFVTLDKSENQFSPSTRYQDYAVSPTLFHWQSQSTTSDTSATGLRYAGQQMNGEQILLFVRPNRSAAFTFLGDAAYQSHHGSRPMNILWRLSHPMPAAFFEVCASFRAA